VAGVVAGVIAATLVVSLLGAALFGYIALRTYRRMRRHPCNRCTWEFLSACTLTWITVTLLVTALGDWAVVAGADPKGDVGLLFGHLVLAMVGAAAALGVALLYGFTRIPELNGGNK
jgi:hypothetical protein